MITYLIEETRPGDEITLAVIRAHGEQKTIKVTLAARPSLDSVSQENK
jgi:S1-C subfamily serine protease